MANEMSNQTAMEAYLEESRETLAKARGLLKQKEDLYQRYGISKAMLSDTSDLTPHEREQLNKQTDAFRDEIAQAQRDAQDRAKYRDMPVRAPKKARHRAFI
ncbi:hypothetical protein SG34_015180 [Thalassomonas viridans]|uniref:Uncharacterized protein n=1 Tax=Thalassomonas viridans TaxID=137584 RepID=A0AAF0C500_9GAMM|nr:hypothetical protein [Thalassomonas viridans]WDE02787.1 hypothetical protein SG34_015180 [Thalassomonas viridans]